MSDKTESSLPQKESSHLPSSPPGLTQYSLLPMEDDASKSAPAASQEPQQTPNHPRHKRVNSDETERPASAQRRRDGSEERSNAEAEQDVVDEEEADPAVRIADFDWSELHERYHNAIKKSGLEEEELMQEWASLMEVLLPHLTCHMTHH